MLASDLVGSAELISAETNSRPPNYKVCVTLCACV